MADAHVIAKSPGLAYSSVAGQEQTYPRVAPRAGKASGRMAVPRYRTAAGPRYRRLSLSITRVLLIVAGGVLVAVAGISRMASRPCNRLCSVVRILESLLASAVTASSACRRAGYW